MKKLIAIVLCLVMVVAAVACTSKPATETKTETKTETAAQGKVFNIYAWNEEFKGFFEKYYKVPEAISRSWTRPCSTRPTPLLTTRWICSWPRPTTSASTSTPTPP